MSDDTLTIRCTGLPPLVWARDEGETFLGPEGLGETWVASDDLLEYAATADERGWVVHTSTNPDTGPVIWREVIDDQVLGFETEGEAFEATERWRHDRVSSLLGLRVRDHASRDDTRAQRVTLEVHPNTLWDALRETGGETGQIGASVVSTLLIPGQVGLFDALCMEMYGIRVVSGDE